MDETRPAKDLWYMKIAGAVALRSTCVKRKVGCVLVDSGGKILSTGYNGAPREFLNCCDSQNGPYCEGRSVSGGGYGKCVAVHAEQNALLQCANVEAIHTCYVTTAPCVHCAKILMNTSIMVLMYSQGHDDAERALGLLMSVGIKCYTINTDGSVVALQPGVGRQVKEIPEPKKEGFCEICGTCVNNLRQCKECGKLVCFECTPRFENGSICKECSD